MMKKIVLLLAICLPTLFFAQSAKDVNTIIQQTIDLEALQSHFNESEINGQTPLIILNDGKIPANLIVFKFKKRVKIMTPKQLATFKSVYKGNLDSYFVFEILDLNDKKATIKATFRKTDKIAINISMTKQDKDWKITESSAS